ncbi:predicted protein [Naegleria gruberi]|uniref:Predicted protein n=1 Tax=Naegleria gruberi TaxID=5762 RepID=D2UY69_NAEGR|nr:uncharacterized protein NAEGRDRAFT_61365 [Naegleria gruberi]EFC50421.1 predicted protein [Naegleria gruberi]|eukprot:XP_002683165.1 predicted protein [Naegleria gruberi strain NEG-M]
MNEQSEGTKNIQQDSQEDDQLEKKRSTYRERSNSAVKSAQITSENQSHTKNLEELTEEMFSDFIQLLQGEMQAGFNELDLLQQMNGAISKKYENLNGRVDIVHSNLQKMMKLYENLQNNFQEVDAIDQSVSELANVVNYLDHYTKQLELQLKPYL